MAPRLKKSTLSPELQGLLKAKLESSGLTEEDMPLLNLEVLTAEQMVLEHPSFKSAPTIKINYIDPRTGKPQVFQPGWDAFIRYRYLKFPTDIGSLAKSKQQRFVQAPNSGICAYFPTNQADWKSIINDPTVPIIITEGELKAAKACKEGYPTIGIGGVHNYRSANHDMTLIPDLAMINWKQRNVYLIFDSDFRSNPSVCSAANGLAEVLFSRGALPHFVPMPDVIQGGKTGLDDFMVSQRQPNALGELIHERAESLTISRQLWSLNDEVIYVYDPGLILMKNSGQKLSPANFKQHAFSDIQVPERIIRADGSISLKDMPAADRWISWHYRAATGRLTYKPGEEQNLANGSVHTSEWNMWPGWGCKAKKGNVELFLKLLKHLFSGADPEDMKWFMQWLAYPLQHPGTKLFTCAALHGRYHGTGKSFVGYLMGQVYGKNFTQIKQADLHGNFTEWAENKQFVLVDDITGTDKRNEADMFKSLITQKETRINIKYVPSFTVPDCLNFLLTSNQPDMVFLEEDDRRFFIHEVKAAPLDDAFYFELDKAMKSGELACAIFDYLLKFDTGTFNPNARARKTSAKELMIADVKSDLGSWVTQLQNDPESILRVGQVMVEGDLFSNKELLNLYDPSSRTQVTANGLGRELRRSNIPLYRDGVPVKTSRGQTRYYVCRNYQKWASAKPEVAIKHLESRYKMGGK